MSTLGEPIGASLLAIVLLNEMLTVIEMIGGALIIVGIYLFLKIQSGPNKALTGSQNHLDPVHNKGT